MYINILRLSIWRLLTEAAIHEHKVQKSNSSSVIVFSVGDFKPRIYEFKGTHKMTSETFLKLEA